MQQFYVFCRTWVGFRDAFPFERFNSVPDSEIFKAIDAHALEWLRDHRAAVKNHIREQKRKVLQDLANRPTLIMRAQPSLSGLQGMNLDRGYSRCQVFEAIRGDRNDSVSVKLARIAGWANPVEAAFGGLSPSRMLLLAETDKEAGEAVIDVLIDRFEEPEYAVLGLRFGMIPVHTLDLGQRGVLERQFDDSLRGERTDKPAKLHQLFATEAARALETTEELKLRDQLGESQTSTSIGGEFPTHCFRLNGSVWQVRLNDESGHFHNLKGFRYIRELLAKPNKLVAATKLIGEMEGTTGAAHEVLDPEAKRKFKDRIDELEERKQIALQAGAEEGLERIEAERNGIIEELKRATGLGGRDRDIAATPAERARQSVRKALDRAYTRLRQAKPPLDHLASHLTSCVQAEGTSYVYRPDADVPWNLS